MVIKILKKNTKSWKLGGARKKWHLRRRTHAAADSWIALWSFQVWKRIAFFPLIFEHKKEKFGNFEKDETFMDADFSKQGGMGWRLRAKWESKILILEPWLASSRRFSSIRWKFYK